MSSKSPNKNSNMAMGSSGSLERRILDAIPNMIGYWNSDLINVFANNAYSNFFGKSPDKICGTHISSLLGESLYQNSLPCIQGALAGKTQVFDKISQL